MMRMKDKGVWLSHKTDNIVMKSAFSERRISFLQYISSNEETN